MGPGTGQMADGELTDQEWAQLKATSKSSAVNLWASVCLAASVYYFCSELYWALLAGAFCLGCTCLGLARKWMVQLSLLCALLAFVVALAPSVVRRLPGNAHLTITFVKDQDPGS